MKSVQTAVRKWLIRILRALGIRSLKTLYWVSFAVLALGVPWCVGAFFHAFDIPVFLSWCGVVPYSSSHLDNAASEVIVHSGHSVHRSPGAMQELLRILLLHLREDQPESEEK